MNQLRLRDIGEVDSAVPYLTLSHCWGNGPTKRLTEKEVSAFKKGLDLEKLPQSFRDAITVVKCLDHFYLWVDSLCIIQDNAQDWRRQSALMADIYQGSWCSIAATGAVDGSGGLFQFSDRVPIPLQRLYVSIPGDKDDPLWKFGDKDDDEDWLFEPHPNEHSRWRGFAPGIYEVCDTDMWYRNIADSPLGHRAWIVQERLLASRVLHFAQDELFWECNKLKACERYPCGIPDRGNLQAFANLKRKSTVCEPHFQEGGVAKPEWNECGSLPNAVKDWSEII